MLCPDLAKEADSECSAMSVTSKDAVCEFHDCFATATRAIHDLSSLPVTAMETLKGLFICSVPVCLVSTNDPVGELSASEVPVNLSNVMPAANSVSVYEPDFELTVCPDSVIEQIYGLSDCPVTFNVPTYKLSILPVSVLEFNYKLSAPPVLPKVSDFCLSVCSVIFKEIKPFVLPASVFGAMNALCVSALPRSQSWLWSFDPFALLWWSSAPSASPSLPDSQISSGYAALPQSPVPPLPRGPGLLSVSLFCLCSTAFLNFNELGASGMFLVLVLV